MAQKKQIRERSAGRPARLNRRVEELMREILTKVAEASYQVALRLGFRGSFITFMSDLQDTLNEVLKEDRRRMAPKKGGESARVSHGIVH